MGLGKPAAAAFDHEYYRRYYYDPRTAVTTRREMQARARLIAAFTEHVGLPVRRLLDAGCGTGMLRAPLQRLLLCRGVLYFSALTKRDWEWNCDPVRTDSNVHLRAARWYRLRLQRNFREVGTGFWLRRGAPLTVWELESQF
jgi:hypothetical protein